MQTLFFLTVFSLVITLMTGIISGGNLSSNQLTDQRLEETRGFFHRVGQVVLNDITPQYLTANPLGATTPAPYITGLSELRQLSSGRYADPALDAWGRPIRGTIVTQHENFNLSGDTDNNISVPVTGFLLVSPGPDGILQTAVPAITTIAQVYGVAVPTDAAGKPLNDDIIYSFDNRAAQQRNVESMKASLNRIGIGALKDLEMRVAPYRQGRVQAYQAQIAAGQAGDITLLNLDGDPNAPRFRKLDTSVEGLANRRALGVDEEFKVIERKLLNNGQFIVDAPQPGSFSAPLVLTIRNDTAKPTPWGKPAGTFKFTAKIRNTAS